MSQVREYQRVTPVMAFQYLGEFPLDFLHQSESVKQGKDACAEVSWSSMSLGGALRRELKVPIGHWLVREFNGSLNVYSPESFAHTYKATVVQVAD